MGHEVLTWHVGMQPIVVMVHEAQHVDSEQSILYSIHCKE